MQPRGQLWFELQRDAGQVLVAVLKNLLADEEARRGEPGTGSTATEAQR